MPPVLSLGGSILGAIGGGSVATGALAVGSTALGVIGSNNAAKSASKAQIQGNTDANKVITETRDANYARLDPYSVGVGDAQQLQRTIAGLNGPEKQAAYYENLGNNPAYQFTRDESLKQMGQSAMAGGTLKSGSRLKSISEFIKGLTTQYATNDFNKAGSIIDTGLRADGAAAGVATNAATQVAGNTISSANSSADATLARSRAFQSGLADIYGTYAANRAG